MPRRRSLSHAPARFAKSSYARRLRAELLEDRRMLAVFSVDNLGDSGPGSLRQAILDANSTPGVPDTIEFASGPGEAFENGGLIRLSSELEITDTLAIDGSTAGAPVILSGDALDNDVTVAGVTDVVASLISDNTSLDDNVRVLNFTALSGDLTLNNLTITGGRSNVGGGIRTSSSGSVNLINSTVSGNSTTGRFASGGGIFTGSGSVSLTNSTVSDNISVSRGGGIRTDSGAVTLTNSTVSGNTGDGVSTDGGMVTLTDSTISDNTGRGVSTSLFSRYGGMVTLTGSIVSGNTGGGIFTGFGSVTLTGSTIRDNTGEFSGGGIDTRYGSVTLTSSTISDNTSESNGGGVSTDDGAITLIDSIVSGNTSRLGFGGGIYTRNSAVTLTRSSVVGNTSSGGGGGISAFGFGGNYNRAVTLIDSTVSGNTTTGDRGVGGGIGTSDGDVTLIRSTVADNTSVYAGGGIFSFEGDVTLTSSTVSGNTSLSLFGNRQGGGGIFSDSGSVTLTDSAVSGNTATGGGNGGGISTDTGSVTLTDSTVSGNTSEGRGGGIFTDAARGRSYVTLTRSTVSGNASGGDGGGIYASAFEVTLTSSTVSGNTSDGDGGGISAIGGAAVFNRSTVSGNTSGGDGGGIHTRFFDSVAIMGSTVSGNTSGGDGGGINTRFAAVALTGSTVSGNTSAGRGGGVYIRNDDLTAANSIIAGNADNGAAPDLLPAPDRLLDITFTLIGDTTGSGVDATTGVGNLLNADPLLGPLADNGGPTLTHAPLLGSPVINRGDPSFVTTTGVDQRGNPFVRVAGGVVDIGAVEAQQIPTFAVGDYNRDGVVNTADYAVWRDSLDPTTPVTPLTGADGDGDGFVTRRDRDVWLSHVGFAFTPPAPSPIVAELAAAAPPLRQPAFLEPEPVATPAEPSPLATIDSAFALLSPAVAPQASRTPAAAQAQVAAPVQDDSLLLLEFGVPGGLADESDNAFANDTPEEEPADEALAVALGAFE